MLNTCPEAPIIQFVGAVKGEKLNAQQMFQRIKDSLQELNNIPALIESQGLLEEEGHEKELNALMASLECILVSAVNAFQVYYQNTCEENLTWEQ